MADRGSMVYYGICDTAAGEQVKVVNVANPVFKGERLLDLVIGDILVVKFDNGNTNTNPKIQLKITEPNQNIGVSADTGLTVATEERYDWAAQGIVSFVYTYIGSNNGAAFSEEGVEITSENSTDVVANYAWKPVEIPLASDDVYGVTKLITNAENLAGNENQPVSYSVIQEQLSNGLANLGLKFLPNGDENNKNIYGTLSISSDGDAEILLPVWTKKTSQLTNNGESEGDRFWSSKTNNYVNELDLGIGYSYIPEGAEQQVMKSFVPYSQFKPSGSETSVNIIRIGRDALKAYQNGVLDAQENPIEPDPYVRLYGKHIDLAMDSTSGVVGIGLCNVKTEPGSYTRNYLFKPDSAIFGLPLKANGGVEANSIIYKNKELEERLTKFKVQVYNTPKLTYKASSATPTNSTKPTLDGKEDDNLALKITDIPTGYRPIAMVGYNLQSDGDEVHFANLWECFVLKSGDDYYIRYGIYNSKTATIKVWVEFKVLFVKDSLASQTVIS